jgi:hypothetical protein
MSCTGGRSQPLSALCSCSKDFNALPLNHADNLHRDGRQHPWSGRPAASHACHCRRSPFVHRPHRLPLLPLLNRADRLFRSAALCQRRRRPRNRSLPRCPPLRPPHHRARIRPRPLRRNSQRPSYSRSRHSALWRLRPPRIQPRHPPPASRPARLCTGAPSADCV